MIAFVSDIHSNTEALEAVLAEVARLGAERVLCLGDVIGYGPEPRETLLRVIDVCELSLLGNHEHACMHQAPDFNPKARQAIDWTREQLNRRDRPRAENFTLWQYLDGMQKEYREGEMLLVHGSPRDPIKEYVVPRDADDAVKMSGCFGLFGEARVCFVGHSHVPGVYPEAGGFLSPAEVPDGWDTRSDRAILFPAASKASTSQAYKTAACIRSSTSPGRSCVDSVPVYPHNKVSSTSKIPVR